MSLVTAGLFNNLEGAFTKSAGAMKRVVLWLGLDCIDSTRLLYDVKLCSLHCTPHPPPPTVVVRI